MRKSFIALTCATGLILTGCDDRQDERVLTGALIGGGVGLISGKVFDADKDWVVVTTLAGAAIGALVAENSRTNECAYKRGDGTYVVRPCR